MYSHSFVLVTGSFSIEKSFLPCGLSLGNVAVDAFFITSGFLVTMSLISKCNILSFFRARVLRIYPGLSVAVIFSVFCVGTFFTKYNLFDYVSDFQTYFYLLKNIIVLFGVEHTLPGVFVDVPYKYEVNGSLWSLTYEVKMYCALAVIYLFVAKKDNVVKNRLLKIIILVVTIITGFLHLLLKIKFNIESNLFHLGFLFFYGACFYLFRNYIVLSGRIVMLLIIILLTSMLNQNVFFVCYSLFMAYILIWGVFIPNGKIRLYNKMGDYSYGMYIYAFPIQQIVVQLIPEISVSNLFLVSFPITLILAFVSWNIVEKKALELK
jgi:peptidoglycan/LPS O-acetylase OafA/YrhL